MNDISYRHTERCCMCKRKLNWGRDAKSIGSVGFLIKGTTTLWYNACPDCFPKCLHTNQIDKVYVQYPKLSTPAKNRIGEAIHSICVMNGGSSMFHSLVVRGYFPLGQGSKVEFVRATDNVPFVLRLTTKKGSLGMWTCKRSDLKEVSCG